ncbi:MAG TPA: LPS export ABC transporter periplasmic protein LptC [Bacteroidales bacterium]
MYKKLAKSILCIFILGMLFSCENSITTIKEITMEDTLPDLTAYNIEYERISDQHRKILLKSPFISRYEGENPYTIFPDGFEITFYDTTGNAISFISANYGINLLNENIMQARNNVVVINYETNETLNTENLVWDQNKKEIYSNTFVKLSSPDRVIYGDSMRAEESFASREIFNISAELEVADSLSY